MTSEELLLPRIKVSEEGYPDMPFKRGEIITLSCKDNVQFFYVHPGTNNQYFDAFFEMYPSIFKPLFWYEERRIEDMPDYVKFDEHVFKVDRYSTSGFVYVIADENYLYNSRTWNVFQLLPATLQEYESYTQKTIQ